MISKIFTCVRPAPATARIESATKAIRGSLRLLRPHANAETITTAMAQTEVIHGARPRTVNAKASSEGSWGRKGRMTYIGIARQTIGMSAPRSATHKAIRVLASPAFSNEDFKDSPSRLL